jgi:SNF2 family DNA or RNA helicase
MALLTGTPTGNHVGEIWALLHLLHPGRYTSYWRFFEMYVEYYQDYFGARKILGVRNPELLRRELSTRMIQRKKEEVAPELPEKIKQTIPLKMTKPQKRTYDRMATEAALLMMSGELLEAPNQMAVLMRLRQILSTTANFDLPDHSGKLDAATEIIQNTDRKVIVFTVFRKTVMAMLNRLVTAGVKSACILGGVSAEDRELAKRAINTGDTRVLVCTIKSGGLGLNLQGASVGIFIDKEWNPIDQLQAEDRMHRIGQTETVHVISLVCEDTVDAAVERLLEKKQQMTDEILKETLFTELLRYC